MNTLHPAVPNLSFVSKMGRMDPGAPLLPNSNHCPTYFVVANFGTILSAILCLQHQPTPFYKFCSLLLINHELQIGQNYSTKVEVPVNHLICGPPTPTSLWAPIFTMGVWLWRRGLLLSWVSQREAGGHQMLLEDAKPAGQSCPFRMCRSCPWRTRTKPFVSAGPGLWLRRLPLLCDIRESHFLDEQVKLIKNISNCLTNLHSLAGHLCQAGWGSLQSLTLKHSWNLQKPEALKRTLFFPLVSGLLPEPFPAVSRQLCHPPRALSQVVDQTETIKCFAEKKKICG